MSLTTTHDEVLVGWSLSVIIPNLLIDNLYLGQHHINIMRHITNIMHQERDLRLHPSIRA